MASQRNAIPRQDRKLSLPHKFNAVGQIVSVKLVQFMNHDNFEVHFGPNVNFVSGQNGSGKSAILQAVQVCLGVKARGTGRGTNVSQYIKKGAPSANVLVRLSNLPKAEAFDYEKYGDVIIVERKLLRSGSGSYQMLNSEGDPIANGAERVKEMLRYFNIDCSNPIVVMTQDFARTFLKPSGGQLEKNLFKVYMKATHFEQHLENMQNAHLHRQSMQSNAEIQERDLEALQEDYKYLRQRLEELQQAESISERIGAMFNCYLCALEEDSRRKLATLEDRLTQEVLQELDGLAQRKEQKLEEIQALKEKKEQETQKLADMQQSAEDTAEKRKSLKDTIKSLTKSKTIMGQEAKRLRQEIAEIKEEVCEDERQLQSMNSDYAASKAAREQEYRKQMAEAEDLVQSCETGATKARQTFRDFDEAVRTAEDNVQRAVEAEMRAQDDARYLDRQLNKLKHARGSRIAIVGGQDMVDLVDRIKKHEREFHHLPLGPIGALLSLDSREKATAVQYAVGHTFRNFIASDMHDAKVFKRVLKSVGNKWLASSVQCYIYSFNRSPYDDVRRPNLPEGVETVLEVLRFDQVPNWHIVQNILIDYGSIEVVGLCARESTAMRAIRGPTGQQLSCIYLPDGRKIYSRGGVEGSVHTGANPTPMLGKDTSESMRELEERRRAALAELQAAEDARCRSECELESSKGQRNRARQMTVQAEDALFEAQSQFELLQSAGPVVESAGEGALADLTASIQTNSDLLRKMTNDAKESQAEFEELKGQLEDVKAEITKSHAELETLDDSLQVAEKDLREAATAVVDAEKELEELQELKQEKEAQGRDREEEKAKLEQSIKRAVEEQQKMGLDASAVEASRRTVADWLQATINGDGDRVACDVEMDDFFTPDKLEREMKKQRKMQEEKERNGGGNALNLEELMEEKESKMASVKRSKQSISKVVEKTEEGIKKREHVYEKITHTVEQTVAKVFSKMMRQRGSSGKLFFDHEKAIISPKVQMHHQGERVEDMKSLSGGEASFTTVCLVLAL
ncbi:unnamed protein product, partial [Ostreobium quekettii]